MCAWGPGCAWGPVCGGRSLALSGLVCAAGFLTTVSSPLPVDAPGLDTWPARLVRVAWGGGLRGEDRDPASSGADSAWGRPPFCP